MFTQQQDQNTQIIYFGDIKQKNQKPESNHFCPFFSR